MEELVHILANHPKTALNRLANGNWERVFEEAKEDEAFSVGAACLIPYGQLFKALRYQSQTVEDLAAAHMVSNDYVVYRIKRAGLYNVYKKRRAFAG